MEHGNGIEYYLELPDDYVQLKDYFELFRLKEGTKEKTLDNLLLRLDLKLIIYNPQTMEFYPRYVNSQSNRMQLKQYMDDGNLYMKKSDMIWTVQ